jgi:microcystin-dependent protein
MGEGQRGSQLLGEVRRFVLGRMPVDWAHCDGSVLPITEHQPLFSLLGWRFGGDGWTTFRLPALRSTREPLDFGIAVNGLYPTRDEAMIENGYVGEIRLFGGEHPPVGWLRCDGRSLPISEPYLGLFEIIGHIWGGDAEHFSLPDLRDAEGTDATVVGRLTYIIAAVGLRPEGA